MTSMERPIRVLFSPTAVFESVRERVGWEWLVALLLLIAVGIGGVQFMYPKMDIESFTRAQIEKGSQPVSEADMENFIAFQKKFGRVMLMVQTGVVYPIGYLLAVLILWVGLKLFGSDWRYVEALSVFFLAQMPQFVKGVLMIPISMARATISTEAMQTKGLIASNLAWLLPDVGGKPLQTLLGGLDLFSIWSVFLLVIGAAIVGRVSRGAAGGLVLAVWALWLLLKVGMNALGG